MKFNLESFTQGIIFGLAVVVTISLSTIIHKLDEVIKLLGK